MVRAGPMRNDEVINSDILAMCEGFCRLHDWLEERKPFTSLRNFPIEIEKFQRAEPTVYKRLQEELSLPAPSFKKLRSFNYDVSAG
jgi:hypothetical protein